MRASGPDPSEWVLRFDACDSTDRDPNQHAIQSIRLWIPRSVALHKIQIKILLLWICPRHFAVCVGKALGIRIHLKCGVSAQPKMMIARCFKHVPTWLHWSFDHQPNFFQVGHFNALRQAKRLFFQQGYKKASKSLRPTCLGNVLVEGFFPT